jgi:hypothetical protein
LYIIYTGICLSCVVIFNKFVLEWAGLYSLLMMLFFILSLAAFFIITRVKKPGNTNS